MIEGPVRKGDRVVRHPDAPAHTQNRRKVVGFVKGTNGRRLVVLEAWWPEKQRYDYMIEPLVYFKMLWTRDGVCKPRQHVVGEK